VRRRAPPPSDYRRALGRRALSARKAYVRRTLPQYMLHAKRFGVELVFETAAGFGRPSANLTITQLAKLARCLHELDPAFDAGRPDKLVKLADAETRQSYLERVAPVLDQLQAPCPTRAGRACEVCGRPIGGRADRRTCSPRCRRALAREGGIGAFTRPLVTPTGAQDVGVTPRPRVTPMPHGNAGFGDRNGRSRRSREVAAVNH
jgi:hypothetical protein